MAYKYILNPITGKLDRVYTPDFGSPVTVGTANAPGSATTGARSDHVHAHGNQPGGALHAVATTGTAGFMSAADKLKLDGITSNAVTAVEVIANNTISTTNGGFTTISGMTYLPAAGTYLLVFSANYGLGGDDSGEVQLYVNNAAQSNTTQQLNIDATGTFGAEASISSTAGFSRLITVNGSETVDVRWRATSGTLSMAVRTMHFIKVA